LRRPPARNGRWHLAGTSDGSGFRGLLDEFELFAEPLGAADATAFGKRDAATDALATPPAQRTQEQQSLLRDYYLARFDDAYRRLTESLEGVQRERADLLGSVSTVMVMQELPAARDTFVLRRGAYDQPGEPVDPRTPGVLPAFPDRAPRNRLGLARWLIEPSHPLTARVTVNRFWQQFFGAGLVRTPEDFGARGEAPTHPELLDWLAVEFIEQGWDVKHLVRLLVTSSAYMQSSDLRPGAAELDPDNRWLARATRVRLDAESLRDSALCVSGLLDSRVGGPSVSPYQPGGLWEELSFNVAEFTAQSYVQSHGRDLYRRSLYTFWKRTLPPPAMAIFDAPTREYSCAARQRTNTPLQALVLMNDPTFVEAARQLAEQVLLEPLPDAEARVADCARRVLGRWPDPAEKAELLGLLHSQRERFQREPGEAEKLLSVGESPRDRRLPAAEHAAWTAVANVLLSLDETITRN
jgi:hypothetical protein